MIVPENLTLAPKAVFETCAAVTTTLVDVFERIVALNLNTARELMGDGTASMHALMNVKNPGDLVALQSASAQPAAEKLLAYGRDCYDIVAQGFEGIVKPFELQFSQVNKFIGAALENAAKSAPAGSDVALAAVQSAIAAANSSYDSVSKATRRVVEMAEANLTATSTAAVKAAGSTITKKKPA